MFYECFNVSILIFCIPDRAKTSTTRPHSIQQEKRETNINFYEIF